MRAAVLIALMYVATFASVALKLAGVLGLSWWWVLAPLWVPFLLLVLVMLISAWGGRFFD